MIKLPTIQPEVQSSLNRGPNRIAQIALHIVRVSLFVAVIVLIHLQHLKLVSDKPAQQQSLNAAHSNIQKFFPTASPQLGATENLHNVFDAEGNKLGYVVQTSPASDRFIGFSGPTNTLIAFSTDDKIIGIDILYSGDTRDHVNQVKKDKLFAASFNGMTAAEVASITKVDGVSGATLTSIAIAESVINRFQGNSATKQVSLKFPDPLTVEDAKKHFKKAASIEQDSQLVALWQVSDANNTPLGSIIRTSPYADSVVGYQGPTDSLIGFDLGGKAIGIAVGKSFDNEPYVSYVREDEYFLNLLNGKRLETLATTGLEEAEIEGVSGATMTSISVGTAILSTVAKHQEAIASANSRKDKLAKPIFNWSLRDFGTAMVILLGLVIAFTSLRGKKIIRICFQLILIGYLGFINGDLISQAMIVGWAKSGVPWANAGGLVLLTLAAFLIPVCTKRNVYCTHLCPHGAAQHLLKNRLKKKIKISASVSRLLKLTPAILLIWCIAVAMGWYSFSLVDIEPFDAWVFRVAGWAAITIAIVGLVASMFVPMAYCKYGCPTGALLNFLRFNSRSDRWSRRDWFAVALVTFAFGLWIV